MVRGVSKGFRCVVVMFASQQCFAFRLPYTIGRWQVGGWQNRGSFSGNGEDFFLLANIPANQPDALLLGRARRTRPKSAH